MAKKRVKKNTEPEVKWSREHCGRYYIECDDDLTIEQLSRLARRHKSALYAWSKADNWVQKRQEYRQIRRAKEEQARAEAIEGAIRKSKVEYKEVNLDKMDTLYTELGAIVYSIYQAHRSEMQMCQAMQQIIARELMLIQRLDPSKQMQALRDRIDMKDFNSISQSLNRATAAIAGAVGLPYFVNTNMALRKAKQEGWELTPPGGKPQEEFADLEADLQDFEA